MIAISIPRRPAAGVPLGRWLLLSAAVHLLLFIGWHSTPQFHGQRETVLSVTLAPGEILPAPSPRLANTSNSPEISQKQKSETGRREIAENTYTEPARPLPNTARTADGQDRSEEVAAARIRARLLSDLARHFEYPLLARLRGWEGTVLIGIDVEADGFLRKIHLARSSGYDVLDQSAIESVRRLGRLQDRSDWPGSGRHQIRLPIMYRLTDR